MKMSIIYYTSAFIVGVYVISAVVLTRNTFLMVVCSVYLYVVAGYGECTEGIGK